MRYIYGMHDPGGEYLFADRQGWIVFTEAVGLDPADKSGRDYRHWSDAGYGVLVRLNNGYGSAGTIPMPEQYDNFSLRVANFIAASKGCNTWIIGNEPNHSQERPNGQAITPPMYIDCFKRIHASVGLYAGDKHSLIPAPVAPWNVETGDWLEYQATIWEALAGLSGGIALHTYSHGASPALITSNEKMGVPYQERFYHFLAYRDLIQRIPTVMRGLPIYITETDQNDPWVDANTGWIQAAYAEINRWNQTNGTQKIHCLCLYRWPQYDRWSIVDKPGVHADLRAAIAKGYQVPQSKITQTQEQESTTLYMPDIANGQSSTVPELPPRQWDARLTQRGIELTEYQPKPGEAYMRLVKGEYWQEKEHTFAETLGKDGQRLPGVTLRWWWGNGNHDQEERKVTELKPNDRWMVDFPMFAHSRSYGLEVLGYPSDKVFGMGLGSVEQPDWNIHVSYKFTFQLTVAPATSQPKPQPEPTKQPVSVPVLLHPVQDPRYRRVTQVFGVNGDYYKRFAVDGVPLRGHNGIDFGTPSGTAICAIADGRVVEAADKGNKGYGKYVKLVHPWGESLYAHLNQHLCDVGDTVVAGETVGLSGNTGNSTGPHLHFGIRVAPFDRRDGWGGFTDPAPYLGADKPAQPGEDLWPLIQDAARNAGISTSLLASLVFAESSFRPNAQSDVGAMGLCQIMPATWAEWAPRVGAKDPYNSADNLKVGAAYLAWLLKQLGNEWSALCAYNFGIGNVLAQVEPPEETVIFTQKVIHGAELLEKIL